MSRPITSKSVEVKGVTHLAPEEWVFVTNDPEVMKHPDRLLALMHEKKRIVVIADVQMGTFEVTDYSERRRFNGRYVADDTETPWRFGGVRFMNIGEIGRAIESAIYKVGDHA